MHRVPAEHSTRYAQKVQDKDLHSDEDMGAALFFLTLHCIGFCHINMILPQVYSNPLPYHKTNCQSSDASTECLGLG